MKAQMVVALLGVGVSLSCTRGGFMGAPSLEAGSLEAGSLEAGSLEAGSLEAGPLEAGSTDVVSPLCNTQVDQDTLALLTFDPIEGDHVADLTGNHPGTLVGVGWSKVSGPAGCGDAVFLPLSDHPYVTLADTPDWQLDQGSVELWVRFDTPPDAASQGILSRDALEMDFPGHLSIFRACDGRIAARLQGLGSQVVRCSQPLPEGVWVHIGLNFGPEGLQLFVNHVLAKETLSAPYGGRCTLRAACGSGALGMGIAGNNNPWVLGADMMMSGTDQATPVQGLLWISCGSVRFPALSSLASIPKCGRLLQVSITPVSTKALDNIH
ncbi:MAG: hypothetical protein JRH20_21700 [Deltaproteobacteria bacterium]|nr:hypothetical protein [Deltaproteobacteria bacterium]